MRWLFVAQDGWGLGHVSRQLGLARELRRLRPRDEMLFLTYSDATHLIAADGFASVKLPSPEWFKSDDQRHIDDLQRLKVSIAVVNATATAYQPEGVVIDTFPVGNRGEFGTGFYRFRAWRPTVRLEGEFSARPDDMVVAHYHDPDGEASYCSNTEIGDLRITVFRREGTRWKESARLVAPRRGHFEVGARERDPAVVKDHVTIA